jgi:hypothetical protein
LRTGNGKKGDNVSIKGKKLKRQGNEGQHEALSRRDFIYPGTGAHEIISVRGLR